MYIDIDVNRVRHLLEEMHAAIEKLTKPTDPPHPWLFEYIRITGDLSTFTSTKVSPASMRGDAHKRTLADLGDDRWGLHESERFGTFHCPDRGMRDAWRAFAAFAEPSQGPVHPGEGKYPENAAMRGIKAAAMKVEAEGFSKLAEAMRAICIRKGMLVYLGPERIGV